MTTALAPDVLDELAEELAPPCGLRWVANGLNCELAAEWAIRFRCCGYVKLLCDYHYQDNLRLLHAVQCRGCKKKHFSATLADVITEAWRI